MHRQRRFAKPNINRRQDAARDASVARVCHATPVFCDACALRPMWAFANAAQGIIRNRATFSAIPAALRGFLVLGSDHFFGGHKIGRSWAMFAFECLQ